jgi:enoyl-CoA hydratase/carnithine racemase
MLFLGCRYSAAKLQEMGVAWRVVSDDGLMDEARSIAGQLSRLPPLSVRAMKRTLNHCATSDLTRALELETEATIAGFLDPETTERLKDF